MTNDSYEDIINLPHHVSSRHPQMSMSSRAAQFAPFAALNGHSAAIAESARITDSQKCDETMTELLNEKMLLLMQHIDSHPIVTIDYFVADSRKEGGTYKSITAAIKKIDDTERVIYLENGDSISFDSISSIL